MSPAQVCEWYEDAAAGYDDTGELHDDSLTFWCGTSTQNCDDAANTLPMNRDILVDVLRANGCAFSEECPSAKCSPEWTGSVDCGDSGTARYWLCYMSEP